MATPSFYRDDEDNEIDLILEFTGLGRIFAIEFKVDENETVRPGFWRACEAMQATDRWLVHSGSKEQLERDPRRLSLLAALELIRQEAKV